MRMCGGGRARAVQDGQGVCAQAPTLMVREKGGEREGEGVGWLVGCCRYVPALGQGPLGCRPRAAGAA